MLELLRDNFYEKILNYDIKLYILRAYCDVSGHGPFSHYYYFTMSFLK